MKPITTDIACLNYSVKADIYEGSAQGPVMLWLIGRGSNRTKQRGYDFLPRLSKELGITTVIFDYTGHGDSPLELEETRPSQHLQEAMTVFDWMIDKYPNRKVFVVGSSYGGFIATHLATKREFDALILRAPAMYDPAIFDIVKKDEDRQASLDFRTDAKALANHPLLKEAAKFKGKVLLVAHENDEKIPKETIDAYKNALKPDFIFAKGIPHQMAGVDKHKIDEYNQQIIDWLKSNL